MLLELHIKNYALIENQHIKFGSGLNILSGETGAGKSILIGALGLLLGDKGDQGRIRTGSDSASVVGTIDVTGNKGALQWLKDHGFEPEGGQVLIKRVIRATGRGAAYIQSEPVTVKDLQDLTSFIFDMHSQHAHQSLFNKDNHRKLLDRFGGFPQLSGQLKQVHRLVTSLHEEMADIEQNAADFEAMLERSRRTIKEVDSLDLQPDEESRLSQEKALLMKGEEIYTGIEEILSGAKGSGDHLFGMEKARITLGRMEEVNNELGTLYERFQNAFYEIEDVVDSLRVLQQGLDFSPERIEEVENRLAEIHGVLKKYGPTYEMLLDNYRKCQDRLSRGEEGQEYKEQLLRKIQSEEQQLAALAQELSNKRKEAARKLEKAIVENLQQLGMEKVEFSIDIQVKIGESGKALCGPNGYDTVEFLISTNPGEPLKPLRAVASGGELSRVMLALKTVLADSDEISSLIFDEIDTGIGGSVALSLGRHLKTLAEKKQVFSITHLASIASFAAKHIKIEKEVRAGHTYTKVRELSADDRIEEVSRMLSGMSADETARNHARELLLSNSQ